MRQLVPQMLGLKLFARVILTDMVAFSATMVRFAALT